MALETIQMLPTPRNTTAHTSKVHTNTNKNEQDAYMNIYILEIKARQRRANKKQVFYVCGKSDKGKGGISVILCQM